MSAEPFTFGIPLIARAAASDWPLVQSLFALTLRSLAGQGDRDFRVVVAGHDRPSVEVGVPYEFHQADWPVEPVRADNLDRGRKTWRIKQAVLAAGGGLLMFVDADDWVDTRLVAAARATILPGMIGGAVELGYAIDPRRRRALPIPHAGLFEGSFDRLCGTSIVARLDPSRTDALHRDPYHVLHEHYRFSDLARAHGAVCGRLDVSGAYLVHTSANHSERHGPHAAWRRSFNDVVASNGSTTDDGFYARFGLDEASVASSLAHLPALR